MTSWQWQSPQHFTLSQEPSVIDTGRETEHQPKNFSEAISPQPATVPELPPRGDQSHRLGHEGLQCKWRRKKKKKTLEIIDGQSNF